MSDCDAIVESAQRHLLAALTRVRETALKLGRECKGDVCAVTRETRLEAEDALRHLATAEEDLAELVGKVDATRSRDLLALIDEARRVRQALVLTNLPLRAELPVSREQGERFACASGEVEAILARLERAAPDLVTDCTWCEIPELEAAAAPSPMSPAPGAAPQASPALAAPAKL